MPASQQNMPPSRHQSQMYYQITGDDELGVIDEDSPEDFAQQSGSGSRMRASSIETDDDTRPGLPMPHGHLASSVSHQHPYAARSYSLSRTGRGEDDYSDEPLISSTQPDYNSVSGEANGRDSFAVDIDPQSSSNHDGFEPFSQHAIEDEDGPKSEPSSRRSSDASLHDVCFPIESPRETDSVGQGVKIWPDLNVLNEFAEQEMREAVDTDNAIVDDMTGERANSLTSLRPSAQRIDETDVEGRLRPAHSIIPWMQRSMGGKRQAPKYPPTHAIDEKSKQYRFAYFREDLDATIHSVNISGLLQPDQTFADLFPPRISTERSSGTPNNLDDYNWDPRVGPRGQTPVDFGIGAAGGSTNGTSSPTSQKRPSLHKRTLTQQMQAQQQAAVPEPSPFWLNVMNPTEEEMRVLSKAFGIHPLTTEDIMLGETREKVELFRNYYFVCFRSIDTNWEKEKSRERERRSKNSSYNKHKGLAAQLIYKSGANGYQEVPASDPLLQQNQQQRKRRQAGGEKTDSEKHTKHSRVRRGELKPLNMYIIVFHEGVLTFHFAPTSHPINVRRRARLLKDYISVSSDWISYALIDDVTDAFAPMIEAIEFEVNSIEEAILKMNSGNSSSESESSDEEDEPHNSEKPTTTSSSISSMGTKRWKEQGDMLRRVGECRKRVMSLLRLLGSKADVIKGFAKRCNEQWEVAPRSEIGLYLGDIQDHIVTMVQSLNHYEKLLARSHSNYLAQINIDMTRVNNDMNDVLGRITVLGTIVLPMNIVTGLWGMNVLVPGQDTPSLYWFWAITSLLMLFAAICFVLARRIYKI
ncbi:hypothetical protein TRVA0_007S01992 [Trichomonascus vanleenenianus]|uniref:magnesium transporter CorA family protein n=1 Tax=Trichomonascus vanleenenianus TaxID=2268995 RepID=UPI003EC9904F